LSVKLILQQWLAEHERFKALFLVLWRCFSPLFRLVNLRVIPGYFWFIRDWLRYKAAGGTAKISDWYPCVLDKTSTTTFDPQYFYQAVWGLKKIMASSPEKHVDVGSEISFVGMLSAVTNVTFVDIRPIRAQLERFSCLEGSIVSLPYDSGSVESLSCMHVIEHIGLGRYGDPLDPDGSTKACHELARVISPGGMLYITVPIYGDKKAVVKVNFNGLRNFSAKEVISYFPDLELVSFSMVHGNGEFAQDVEPENATVTLSGFTDYALGMFEFRRPAVIERAGGEIL
jgi:hypothetical protein